MLERRLMSARIFNFSILESRDKRLLSVVGLFELKTHSWHRFSQQEG